MDRTKSKIQKRYRCKETDTQKELRKKMGMTKAQMNKYYNFRGTIYECSFREAWHALRIKGEICGWRRVSYTTNKEINKLLRSRMMEYKMKLKELIATAKKQIQKNKRNPKTKINRLTQYQE